MKTELELLKERISQIKRIQKECNHEWNDLEYDPENKKNQLIVRFSKTCKKCQKKEYTYKRNKTNSKTFN